MRILLTLILLYPGALMAQYDHHQEGQHHHGDVHHDFSDVDKWLERFEGSDRDEYQKPAYLVELMDLKPGMTVADLGAGTGYFLPYLSKAVGPEGGLLGKVLGLDPEPKLVAFMKERIAKEGWANCEARQIPYDSPDLQPGSVDRILIVNTWHHIENRGEYAAKLRQALAPGGEVWIVDFTKESPRGPGVEHRLTAEQVIEELGAGGLEGVVREKALDWQYVVVGR